MNVGVNSCRSVRSSVLIGMVIRSSGFSMRRRELRQYTHNSHCVPFPTRLLHLPDGVGAAHGGSSEARCNHGDGG